MEEDEIGTLSEVRHREYASCARCGKVELASRLRSVPGDEVQSASAYEYLCGDCYAALVNGEKDLPTSLTE